MKKASKQLLEHVRQAEGLSLTAYKKSDDTWTIGYGHTKGVRQYDRISKSEAERYLLSDLAPIEKFLSSVPQVKTQGQFDALADFAFNLGLGRLKSSTLFKYVKAGRPVAEVQTQFRRWIYCNNKVLDGLVKRREWEARRYAQ